MAAAPAVAAVRFTGLAGLLALVGLGATGIVAGFFEQSSTQTSDVKGTVSALSIDAGTGDVVVEVAPAGTPARVTEVRHWSFTQPRTTNRLDAGTLRLASSCDGLALEPCSVDWTVSVPVDAAVTVQTGTGDVRVLDTAGRVSVQTGTGDVVLRDVTAGTVRVDTGTGDARMVFATAPDSVTVNTGTGDVSLGLPPGASYRITGDSGVGSRGTNGVLQDPASSHLLRIDTGTGDVSVTTTG